MENGPSTTGFSVDFLLSQVAASARVEYSPDTDYAALVLQSAEQAEAQALAIGDDGNRLIQEVEAYLIDATDDMEQFANLAQRLGDTCLDHSTEHELADESADSSEHLAQHTSNIASHDHHGHERGGSTGSVSKKRKSKKRQRRSLLDFYIWRLQQLKK